MNTSPVVEFCHVCYARAAPRVGEITICPTCIGRPGAEIAGALRVKLVQSTNAFAECSKAQLITLLFHVTCGLYSPMALGQFKMLINGILNIPENSRATIEEMCEAVSIPIKEARDMLHAHPAYAAQPVYPMHAHQAYAAQPTYAVHTQQAYVAQPAYATRPAYVQYAQPAYVQYVHPASAHSASAAPQYAIHPVYAAPVQRDVATQIPQPQMGVLVAAASEAASTDAASTDGASTENSVPRSAATPPESPASTSHTNPPDSPANPPATNAEDESCATHEVNLLKVPCNELRNSPYPRTLPGLAKKAGKLAKRGGRPPKYLVKGSISTHRNVALSILRPERDGSAMRKSPFD